MPARCHSESAPDSRRVPLCDLDYRAPRTVQAALQTATAAVSSHELVSCGNGGTMLLLSGYPRPCCYFSLRIDFVSLVRLLRLVCIGGKAQQCFPSEFVFYNVFRISLRRAPEPLCNYTLDFIYKS